MDSLKIWMDALRGRGEAIKNGDGVPFCRYTTKSPRDGAKRKPKTFKAKDDDILRINVCRLLFTRNRCSRCRHGLGITPTHDKGLIAKPVWFKKPWMLGLWDNEFVSFLQAPFWKDDFESRCGQHVWVVDMVVYDSVAAGVPFARHS